MASFSAVRAGLKVRMATLAGMTAYSRVPAVIKTPAAVVEPGEVVIDYDATMGRGEDDMGLSVLVLVDGNDDEAAQAALDEYLDGSSASSVKAAVEGDETLGGIVSFARVSRAVGYGPYTYNGVRYLGVRFEIEVTT